MDKQDDIRGTRNLCVCERHVTGFEEKVRRALPAQSLEGRSGRQWCHDHLPRFGERIRSTESDCRTICESSPRAIHQLHERFHGCGAERHKRAGDQGLDNLEGAGCAEGLSIVEEVPVVESEAIVDVKRVNNGMQPAQKNDLPE